MTDVSSDLGHPNELAFKLFETACHQPDPHRVNVLKVGGATVLDFAIERVGTLESGIVLSHLCLGGLGTVDLAPPIEGLALPRVVVNTNSPLLACIGSQYAGWPISLGEYFAMGSGPMRMPRGKEEILSEFGLHRSSLHAVGILESNQVPGEEIIALIASECQVKPENLGLCVARTASWPGSVQVVARSVEVAMHKLHELGFDLATVVHGAGSAPIPPVAADDMTALGWTNDAVLYGAKVFLTVETTDEAIESIVHRIPSCSSDEFGIPFLDIFEKYDKNFYKIDKLLFSPAEVVITNRLTGRVFEVGEIRNDILKKSFGI